MTDAHALSVTRFIAAPPATVWKVITQRLEEWWCPVPWRTEVIEYDWRSGGRMATIMHGPDGERHESEGVFLEVVPQVRFVFTDAFRAGWVPQEAFMVGTIALAPEGEGTRYTASAQHWTKGAMERHRDMGFEPGWSAVADQLAALAEASV